jgi:hypothetical protein
MKTGRNTWTKINGRTKGEDSSQGLLGCVTAYCFGEPCSLHLQGEDGGVTAQKTSTWWVCYSQGLQPKILWWTD